MADAFLLLIDSIIVGHRVRSAIGPLQLARNRPHGRA